MTLRQRNDGAARPGSYHGFLLLACRNSIKRFHYLAWRLVFSGRWSRCDRERSFISSLTQRLFRPIDVLLIELWSFALISAALSSWAPNLRAFNLYHVICREYYIPQRSIWNIVRQKCLLIVCESWFYRVYVASRRGVVFGPLRWSGLPPT